MRSRTFVTAFTLLLVVAAVIIPLSNIHAQTRPGDVRVFHALPTAGEVNIYLNDIFAGTLDFAEAADYILVPTGDVTLRAFAPGEGPDGTPLFEDQFPIGDDQHENAVLLANGDETTLGVFDIDRSPLEFGWSRVNFIHAAPNGPDITINLAPSTPAVDTNFQVAGSLSFGNDEALGVRAGSYAIQMGDDFKLLDFNAGTIYSVFIVDAAGGSEAVDTRIFSSATQLQGEAGFVRFAHAIPEGPAVDLYLNGTLAGPNLEYGKAAGYMAVVPGNYDAVLVPAGSDSASATPLLSTTINVQAGQSQTGIVMGTADAPSVTVYADDRSIPPDGQSRASVFNAHAAPLNVTVDGETVLEGLASGQLSQYWDMTEGPHDYEIAADSTTVATLEDVSVNPHTAVNLSTFVVTDAGAFVLRTRPLGC